MVPECSHTTRSARRSPNCGHQQHGVMALPGEATKHREHLTASVQVQAAGRLVTQQQRRLLHDRARDRHPLLLTAGQLSGESISHLGQARPLERRRGCAGGTLAGEFGDDLDVLQRGQRGHQVEELEHEPDPVASVRRACFTAECRNILACHQNSPGRSAPRYRRPRSAAWSSPSRTAE